MQNAPVWSCERSVDVDAPAFFVWRYMTDVRNWSDPPAEFELEGPFAEGTRGVTRMPDRRPIPWTVCDVDHGRAYTIAGAAFAEEAHLDFRWRFEVLSEAKTRLTQRLELTGANAARYVEAVSVGFEPNLEPGMQRVAALIARAWAREDLAAET